MIEQVSYAKDLRNAAAIRNMDGDEILEKYAAYTSDAFKDARQLDTIRPLLIPARNEQDDLPGTLLAAALTGEALPIVLDNQSKDNTARVARKMGALTVSVDQGNKMAATQEGLRFVTRELGAKAAYLTDADTLIPRGWIRGMTRETEVADQGQGSAVFGNALLWHGASKLTDVVLTSGKLGRALKQSLTNGEVIARGANYAMQFDEDGNMIDALDSLSPDMFNGDDYHISQALKSSGANVVNTLSLDTANLSRNDRVSSLRQRFMPSYSRRRDAEYTQHYLRE